MPSVDPAAARWLPAALVGLPLLMVQIALGGWVSTNYAALACTISLCAWRLDAADGLRARLSPVARARHDRRRRYLSQDALVAIHWTHRTFRLVVVLYLVLAGRQTASI